VPHSHKDRAFQKKGGGGFSRKHNIQKKPEQMGISLRKKGALKAEIQGREATGMVVSSYAFLNNAPPKG